MLETNIEKIQSNISQACQAGNRSVDSVTTIAVTKSVSCELTKAVVEHGYTHLAENRVDKMLEKQAALKDYSNLTWHFIGNLQRRKVKSIINQIDYFHALDSLRLAEEIQKRAKHEIKCFVEVNVSGEKSKQGVSFDETIEFINELKIYDKIKVVGLMTMAPLSANDDELKKYFDRLVCLQETIALKSYPHAPCTETSMGMTNDYQIAIQSGATFVRIGTAFFSSIEN